MVDMMLLLKISSETPSKGQSIARWVCGAADEWRGRRTRGTVQFILVVEMKIQKQDSTSSELF